MKEINYNNCVFKNSSPAIFAGCKHPDATCACINGCHDKYISRYSKAGKEIIKARKTKP